MENIIYSWNFSEQKNRWAFWYIIAISIVIWVVFWGILTWQYGLSIVMFLAAWVLFFIENNSSENVLVQLNSLWIQIGENFYDYTKIENFSIIYDKSNPIYCKLVLNKRWLKVINLKIDNKVWEDLKQILPNFIREEKNWELNFADKLIILLKL